MAIVIGNDEFQANLHDLIKEQSKVGILTSQRSTQGTNVDGSNMDIACKDLETTLMKNYGDSPVAMCKYHGDKTKPYGKLSTVDKAAVDLYLMDQKLLPENPTPAEVDIARENLAGSRTLGSAQAMAHINITSAIKHRTDLISPDDVKSNPQSSPKETSPQQTKPTNKTPAHEMKEKHHNDAKSKHDDAKPAPTPHENSGLLVSTNPIHLQPFLKDKGLQPFTR